MEKFFISIALVTLLSSISVVSLLHSGLPPTHDGEYHVIRFYEFQKVLQSGVIYPRWAPDLNNGYGVPLFTYVYPLPNYIASIIYIFTHSFIQTFTLSMFIASILGGVLCFLWIRSLFGIKAGIAAAVCYTFSPYHAVDIFVRGSVGEVWSLALFPGFLWASTRFVRTRKFRLFSLSIFFLALTILAHNILALLFFFFGVCYLVLLIVFKDRSWKLLLSAGAMVLFTLFLTAIFWMPALLEAQYVIGLKIYDVTSNFPELYQLLIPSWGTGFSPDDPSNFMSLQIGVINILVILLATGILLKSVFTKKSIDKLLIFCILWFFCIFFLMLKSSNVVWQHVPFMNYFQFPWRLLSLETLLASFLAGYLLRKARVVFLVVFILLTILLSSSYLKPAYYHQRTDAYYIHRSNFIDGTNSVGNDFNTLWMNKRLRKNQDKIRRSNALQSIKTINISPQAFQLILTAARPTTLTANLAYFPGWSVFIDGKKTKSLISSDGLLSFALPSGTHRVSIMLLPTTVQTIAASFSVMSFVLLCLVGIHNRCVTMKK